MRAFLTLLRAAWTYAEGRRLLLLLCVGLFLVANVISLIEPILIGKILNSIQQISTVPHSVRSLVILFGSILALDLGFWLFHGPARVLEQSLGFHVRRKFKEDLFARVTSFPIQWHKDHHSAQTINQISKATNALYDFVSNSFQFIEMVVRLVGSIIALTILLPIAAGLSVVVSVSAILLVFLIDRFLIHSYRRLNEREHEVSIVHHDYLTNIFTVISLRLEQLARTELVRRMSYYFPLFRRTAMINEVKWFLTTMIISIMTVSVMAWYVLHTLSMREVLLAGTFFMLYQYLQKIGSSFYTFAWKYSDTIQQYANILSVDEILKKESPRLSSRSALPKDWKTIEIRNLHFSFDESLNGEKPTPLRGIDITLSRGGSIALVGESGSGKSTLLTLLRGMRTPSKVSVSCDGHRLRDGLRPLGSSVTLIPQDPEIFSNTIEYNITVDTVQKRSELQEDIALARFSSVVDRLPNGLKTHIAEKGLNLSGGEKQRLALARGFFAAKQSDIILLDEPTSSVDSRNEMMIYRNLLKRFSDRCIVSSIHKLHILPLFDEIYVLEKGRVAEHGSFEQLLLRGGYLMELWSQYLSEKEKASGVTSPESTPVQQASSLPL